MSMSVLKTQSFLINKDNSDNGLFGRSPYILHSANRIGSFFQHFYDSNWRTWMKIQKLFCFCFLLKANFPQEATFFILCHRFFLHSSLFKSCCHTTFEFLSHCWDWASLLERAATAAASQQLTELKFKLGREALSTQQSCKKNWWQTNFKHLF